MSVYAKPKTNEFMGWLETLRLSGASEEQARDKAASLYPGAHKTNRSKRALFMRVFKAPLGDFTHALFMWKHGNMHFGEIANTLVPKVSGGGAPTGNLHATIHRTKSTLKRCNSSWRALNESDKEIFLAENGLMHIPD